MYKHLGIDDWLFVALYGAVAMMAVLAGIYLLAARANVFAREVSAPRVLRRWAAAFMAAVALSHVWWALPVEAWFEVDKAMRDVVCFSMDLLTLVPLMMAWLLRLLQDRRRPVWPWFVAHVPVLLMALQSLSWPLFMYQVALILAFVIYYYLALCRYGRWLRDNFADLEHKEVWQSLVLMLVLLAVYSAYTTNGGSLFREYLSQVLSVGIIAFVLWRTEGLQALSTDGEIEDDGREDKGSALRADCNATL